MDQSTPVAKQPEQLRIIGADLINRVLNRHFSELEQLVIDTYHAHHSGGTINPDSYFLRYPEQPQNRIIALPAHIGGQTNVSGIKWIASFPDNIAHGLQRASASLILNDGATGYPIAMLESSIISATRTVVSAAAGLYFLKEQKKKVTQLGIVGSGFIARKMIESLVKLDWQIDEILLFDLNKDYAQALSDFVQTLNADIKVSVSPDLETLVRASEVLITTTTAGEPYITDLQWFVHNPTVINLSLRDFAPEIILASNNIFDDVDHCLKANTSPHLAYQMSGDKAFVSGHFGDLIAGNLQLAKDKPTVFSPFGLGVLDIALGVFVLNASDGDDDVTVVSNFFGDHSRW